MKDKESRSTKNNVLEHYEDQWDSYSEEDVFSRIKNLGPVIDSIISPINLKDNTTILDLGTGPAIVPIRLVQTRNISLILYGIDLSKNAILLGRSFLKNKNLRNIWLILGDCSHLPFSNESFDAVVSNATINLLLDKGNGFLEMARVTKKGGSVVVGDCIVRERKCKSQEVHNGKLWSQCIAGAPTKEEMQDYANMAGLKTMEIFNLTQKVTDLVKADLWRWPEFLEHDLKYHVFSFKKEP